MFRKDRHRFAIWLLTLGLFSPFSVRGEEAEHWAFQSVRRPEVPTVQDADWPRNPLDRFVLSKLEQSGIQPAEPADATVLLRRVVLDLTGLPPTPDQVDAFLANPSEEAYQQAIDQTLKSPHYGERWGRHWLDVARYADSAGQEFDHPRPIWKYRDWVINAVSRDLPFNEFVTTQIAGDLVPGASVDEKIATGFQGNAIKEYGDHDAATIDRTNAFGTAFLGLTLGCAQCHDHKFDPISQAEYYQLYAFFDQSTETPLDLSEPKIAAQRDALDKQISHLKRELKIYQSGPDPDPQMWCAQLTPDDINQAVDSELRQAIFKVAASRTPEERQRIEEGHRIAIAEFQASLDLKIDQWSARMSSEERNALSPPIQSYLAMPLAARSGDRPQGLLEKFWEQDAGLAQRNEIIKELETRRPDVETAIVLTQRASPPPTQMFVKGDNRNRGEKVAPNVPDCLPPIPSVESEPTRLSLARWLVSPEHPLTARVAVNRIWQRYFGRGLVPTSDDFGIQTAVPVHQDLLDWLAAEFMENGWSLQHIHRLILASSTYRQASHVRSDLIEVDPENELLARQNRLRLEGEIIRDVALASSGLLNRTVGGPSVFPYQPDGVMDARADKAEWIVSEGPDRYRRGMYTHFWRLTPHPYFNCFDMPDGTESCPRRATSNTPLQALTLLNSPWFTESAHALAKRILKENPGADSQVRLDWAFRTCVGRAPTSEELTVLLDHLAVQTSSYANEPERATVAFGEAAGDLPVPEFAAWSSVARVVLNLDEFITRE